MEVELGSPSSKLSWDVVQDERARPSMVLPGTQLFPNALLPLFIFEPRYRAMLAHALAGPRMFCVASVKPGVLEAADDDDLHSVSGVGLVRACVGKEDGT